jgi:hypothetical protein
VWFLLVFYYMKWKHFWHRSIANMLVYVCEVSVNTIPHFIDSTWRVRGDFILGSLPYCCGVLWQKNLYSLSHFLILKVHCVLNNMQDLTKCVLFLFLPCFVLKKTPLNVLLGYECMKVIFGPPMWQWLKDTWSWIVWFPLLTLFSPAYTLALLF